MCEEERKARNLDKPKRFTAFTACFTTSEHKQNTFCRNHSARKRKTLPNVNIGKGSFALDTKVSIVSKDS